MFFKHIMSVDWLTVVTLTSYVLLPNLFAIGAALILCLTRIFELTTIAELHALLVYCLALTVLYVCCNIAFTTIYKFVIPKLIAGLSVLGKLSNLVISSWPFHALWPAEFIWSRLCLHMVFTKLPCFTMLILYWIN